MPHFTDKRFEALTHPIRYSVIFKYLGQLSSLMAVLSSVPLVVSLLSGEYLIGLRYTGIIILLFVLGLLSRNIKTPANVQTNEAMTVAVMVFVVSSMLMTYPLMESGIAFQDALFESVSAVTTTGLSTLPTVEDKPITFLFSRSWMQWYGGLGIVVLSLALLTSPGFVAKRLAATQFEKEEISEGARIHAKKVLIKWYYVWI